MNLDTNSGAEMVVKRRLDARPRSILEPYDTLRLEKREERTSVYRGERGTYVIEKAEAVAAGKPVAWIYLNRAYLTGLFKARREGDYSGDIKGVDGVKEYIVLRREGENLRIYRKKKPGK